MLMKDNEMKALVSDFELVATKITNKNHRKKNNICDVEVYYGPHGIGYAVTKAGKTDYYVFKDTRIDKKVYNGAYVVYNAVVNSGLVQSVKYREVNITPTWEITLNTETGDIMFRRVETYHLGAICGNCASICWLGKISERTLRLKIRRLMKRAVDSGKARLI